MNLIDTFIFGTIPLWMLVLWLSFSTLFDEILVFLKKYKFLVLFLSCILRSFYLLSWRTSNVL